MKNLFIIVFFALLALDKAEATISLITTISVGSGPQEIEVNPATGIIYVANISANSVSVINTATDTVTATITGFTGPLGVAVKTSTNTIYVANSNGSTVSVVNGATNAITATITVGSNPYEEAYDENSGMLYVANHGSSSVSVINTSTNTVSATISVFSSPFAVEVDPDLGYVYVTQDGGSGGGVDVINASTNTVISTISTGYPYLDGSCINNLTKRLYVSATLNGVTIVINTLTNAIVTSFATTSGSNTGQNIGCSPNSNANLVYSANRGAGTFSSIDGLRNTLLLTTTRSGSPFSLVYYPAMDRIYVTLYGSAAVAVYSAGTPTYTSQDNGVFETP